MDIREELKSRAAEAETVLKKYLPEVTGAQRTVIEAMNYSFLAGGKRLRPILMQETYRLFGGTGEVVEPFMAAIEMIHTYSLVHDDLPAMDDDDYRRGRKTTHVLYGEGMAVLAGDGLLNLAFETALSAADLAPGDENVTKALQILARGAGIYGMIGGQSVDVESEGTTLDRKTLLFIYEKKTGALIEAAMLIGAVLAGANEKEQALIRDAAHDIGMAFQIRDDILDVVGDAEVLGKPTGSDQKNDKTTYVTIYGLSQSSEEVDALSRKALALLKDLPGQNEFLNEMIVYMSTREK